MTVNFERIPQLPVILKKAFDGS